MNGGGIVHGNGIKSRVSLEYTSPSIPRRYHFSNPQNQRCSGSGAGGCVVRVAGKTREGPMGIL